MVRQVALAPRIIAVRWRAWSRAPYCQKVLGSPSRILATSLETFHEEAVSLARSPLCPPANAVVMGRGCQPAGVAVVPSPACMGKGAKIKISHSRTIIYDGHRGVILNVWLCVVDGIDVYLGVVLVAQPAAATAR